MKPYHINPDGTFYKLPDECEDIRLNFQKAFIDGKNAATERQKTDPCPWCGTIGYELVNCLQDAIHCLNSCKQDDFVIKTVEQCETILKKARGDL